jgi:hypothetical protein
VWSWLVDGDAVAPDELAVVVDELLLWEREVLLVLLALP